MAGSAQRWQEVVGVVLTIGGQPRAALAGAGMGIDLGRYREGDL